MASTKRSWPTQMPVIAHVDMDAFFAAVEVRDNPALRNQPVLIGMRGPRSVVATASYEARKFGARSAMPMSQALALCPKAVVVPPRMARYAEASAEIFRVFSEFSPIVEGLSLDEAYLDLSHSQRLLGEPDEIGRAIKRTVFERTALTCSVGICAIKFVAKIAGGLDKPDGLTVVYPGDERTTLAPLKVEVLPGVGQKTLASLHRAGIRVVADLQELEPTRARRLLGESADSLLAMANARAQGVVSTGRVAQQISCEDTYLVDKTELEDLRRELLRQSTELADRLHRAARAGTVVRLKLRDADFRTITRQRSVESPVAQAQIIYAVVCELLAASWRQGTPIRLTGVSVSGFEGEDEPEQLSLALLSGPSIEDAVRGRQAAPDRATALPPQAAVGESKPAMSLERARALQATMSAVRGRFGKQALQPASIIGERPTAEHGDEPGTQRGHREHGRPRPKPEPGAKR